MERKGNKRKKREASFDLTEDPKKKRKSWRLGGSGCQNKLVRERKQICGKNGDLEEASTNRLDFRERKQKWSYKNGGNDISAAIKILKCREETDFKTPPAKRRLIEWGRMGRVKLKIKRLESLGSRQATYGKRKAGILKKARELSVLCDVDIILLMFSPSGKPSICKGKRSIEEIIAKYAQLTPQERAKRKIEGLEALKKTFKKLDHDVNISEFLCSSFQTAEDLATQSRILQTQLSDAHKRLSCWTNLDKISSMEHLWQLENSIRESLNQIQAHKEYLGKQQLMSLECNNQFQNEMQVPFRMATEQKLPPMPWITNNDGQQIILADDPNLFSHREVECSASSSLGSYSGYFGTGKSSELSNSSQETGVNGLLNELNGNNASLRLQLAGHYPNFLPYNFDLMNDAKYQSAGELNQQESPVDFAVNGSFEISKTGYDTTPSSWASSSGPCGITMFDEPLFSPQPN